MDQLVDALVPGMPAAARAAITAQAQGIPLFAVETIRALIDRDIVQPVEGVYRLTGDVGELAVPDSLHALLAARLDALDPPLRRLVADAAVLGTTFPAEALIAVSAQDEDAVRAGLAEPGAPRGAHRVRRPAVTGAGQLPVRPADAPPGRLRHPVPARPQGPPPGRGRAPARRIPGRRRGSHRRHRPPLPRRAGRRTRRSRHGRDPRPGHRRADPGRRARRANRRPRPCRQPATPPPPSSASGAPRERTTRTDSKMSAGCGNVPRKPPSPTPTMPRRSSTRAGPATITCRRGQPRAAARAQAIAGRALRLRGRHAEARDQLTAAVDVLNADPDADTVQALEQLAVLEVFAGSPDADALTTEALTLGQALDVGPRPALRAARVARDLPLQRASARPNRPPTSTRASGSPARSATTWPWDAPC